jgi:hypothetical protein
MRVLLWLMAHWRKNVFGLQMQAMLGRRNYYELVKSIGAVSMTGSFCVSHGTAKLVQLL